MKDQMTSRHPPTALKRNARSPGGFQNCKPTEAKAKTMDKMTALMGEPARFRLRKNPGAQWSLAISKTRREVA